MRTCRICSSFRPKYLAGIPNANSPKILLLGLFFTKKSFLMNLVEFLKNRIHTLKLWHNTLHLNNKLGIVVHPGLIQ